MRARASIATSLLATFAAVLIVLHGQVTDATTGQPMPGIHLQFSGASHVTATTDKNGRYVVLRLRAGTYAVTLSSSDVPPTTQHVSLRKQHAVKNFIVCSMTLDYSCRNAIPGGPG